MAFDDVTIFEVHLPTDRFSGDSGEETRKSDGKQRSETEDDESSSGGPPIGRLLVGLLVLVGVAAGVRRFRSGGDDEEFERAYRQPDVETETEVESAT